MNSYWIDTNHNLQYTNCWIILILKTIELLLLFEYNIWLIKLFNFVIIDTYITVWYKHNFVFKPDKFEGSFHLNWT